MNIECPRCGKWFIEKRHNAMDEKWGYCRTCNIEKVSDRVYKVKKK